MSFVMLIGTWPVGESHSGMVCTYTSMVFDFIDELSKYCFVAIAVRLFIPLVVSTGGFHSYLQLPLTVVHSPI